MQLSVIVEIPQGWRLRRYRRIITTGFDQQAKGSLVQTCLMIEAKCNVTTLPYLANLLKADRHWETYVEFE